MARADNPREQILLHIKSLLATVDGVAEVDGVRSVFRNRGEVKDEYRPALVLLDGREVRQTDVSRRGVLPPPAIYVVVPQIWILLKARDNVNNDTLNNELNPIGEELSVWQEKVLGAIFGDSSWPGLLGESGWIDYLGADTDMEAMAEMVGEMMLNLQFAYYFNPSYYI